MTKQVSRREPDSDSLSSRAKRYAEIERQSGPEGSHKASKALHQRPQTRGDARTEQFLRIERGSEA